jgi:hypothetical protein
MIKLTELSYQTYRYLFDIKYFAKQLSDDDYEEKEIKQIVENADKLYQIFLKIIDDKTIEAQTDELTEAKTIADEILKQLRVLKCSDEYINDKVDLIVEAFAVKEKAQIIIENLKN